MRLPRDTVEAEEGSKSFVCAHAQLREGSVRLGAKRKRDVMASEPPWCVKDKPRSYARCKIVLRFARGVLVCPPRSQPKACMVGVTPRACAHGGVVATFALHVHEVRTMRRLVNKSPTRFNQRDVLRNGGKTR